MSKYIPRHSVHKTVMNQVSARLVLEKRLERQIEDLKVKLRDVFSVTEELMSLGLTRKHAVGLNSRLNERLIIEEKLKGLPEPVIAPINDASSDAPQVSTTSADASPSPVVELIRESV